MELNGNGAREKRGEEALITKEVKLTSVSLWGSLMRHSIRGNYIQRLTVYDYPPGQSKEETAT